MCCMSEGLSSSSAPAQCKLHICPIPFDIRQTHKALTPTVSIAYGVALLVVVGVYWIVAILVIVILFLAVRAIIAASLLLWLLGSWFSVSGSVPLPR